MGRSCAKGSRARDLSRRTKSLGTKSERDGAKGSRPRGIERLRTDLGRCGTRASKRTAPPHSLDSGRLFLTLTLPLTLPLSLSLFDARRGWPLLENLRPGFVLESYLESRVSSVRQRRRRARVPPRLDSRGRLSRRLCVVTKPRKPVSPTQSFSPTLPKKPKRDSSIANDWRGRARGARVRRRANRAT